MFTSSRYKTNLEILIYAVSINSYSIYQLISNKRRLFLYFLSIIVDTNFHVLISKKYSINKHKNLQRGTILFSTRHNIRLNIEKEMICHK